ncbi:MAG TPA: alpha/beta fold hydrolase [Polyangiaceae bacterium]|jgi:pimeloyl-ACP methyl ester carboxylesterase|nr:alpha/beta fold hydrolase [Polyangiaceae bacterium]
MFRVAMAALLACTACRSHGAELDSTFDVGSLRLHLVCSGEGSPPVVFDSGLGSDATAWASVEPAVARFTRTCAYDRAGMGSSKPAPRPHENVAMAEELRGLLAAAGVPGPYVLVGHSMGGLNAQLFAKAHPADVAAMVLVDSMTSAQVTRYWALLPDDKLRELRAGVAKLPENTDFDALLRGLDAAKPSGVTPSAKPLVILTRSKEDAFPGASSETAAKMLDGWQKSQDELSSLSTNHAARIVADAHHPIQNDAPDVVVAAIREAWDAARTGRAVNVGALPAR